jgi:hypothetical protein
MTSAAASRPIKLRRAERLIVRERFVAYHQRVAIDTNCGAGPLACGRPVGLRRGRFVEASRVNGKAAGTASLRHRGR